MRSIISGLGILVRMAGSVLVIGGCVGGLVGSYAVYLALAVGPRWPEVLVSVLFGLPYLLGLYWVVLRQQGQGLGVAVVTMVGLLAIASGWTFSFSPPGFVFWMGGLAILAGAALIALGHLVSWGAEWPGRRVVHTSKGS